MSSVQTIIFSPHLDDAVFSLGGTLIIGALGTVRVVNIYTTSRYSVSGNLDPASVTETRMAEDRTAMAMLGIEAEYWGFEDTTMKQQRYPDEASYLDPNADPLRDDSWGEVFERINATFARFPQALFLAPLGIGHHIEHRIVAQCCLPHGNRGPVVGFYEDGTYFRDQAYSRQCAAEFGLAESVTIAGPEYDRKARLIDIYASQLDASIRQNIRIAFHRNSGESIWTWSNLIDRIKNMVTATNDAKAFG